MNDRHLACFVAIYEEHTVSGAAERLRVSVSSLSHHLCNLEGRLNVQLFTRHRRGMEPTAAGQRFYGHARAIIGAMRDAEQDMQAVQDHISGQVSVALAGSVIRAIGFALVQAVSRDYPDVRLTLTESLSSTVMGELNEGRADMAVAFNPQAAANIRVTPILEEEMVFVGQAGMIGATDDPIRFDDVLEHHLILLRQGLSARALTQDTRLLKQLESRAKLQVNSVQTITESLLAGLGATVGTRLIMNAELENGRLHARQIIEPTLERSLCLIERQDRTPTFAMEHVRALVQRLIQDSVQDGRWHARLSRPASPIAP